MSELENNTRNDLLNLPKRWGHSTRIAILHMFPQLFDDCYPS